MSIIVWNRGSVMTITLGVLWGLIAAGLIGAAMSNIDKPIIVLACGLLGIVWLWCGVAVRQVWRFRRCPHCFSRIIKQRVNGRRHKVCSGCGWQPPPRKG